jgi:mercuric ion binding protein
MKITNLLVITAAAAIVLPLSLQAESRTWTDSASGKTIEGELVSVDGDKVTLKRGDGKTFTTEISRFSAGDQKFIASQNKPEGPYPKPDQAADPDAPAGSENDVTLTGLHLCCGGCEKSIEKALAEMAEDIDFDISRSSKTINLKSEKPDAIQGAIDAIAKAGYYGESNHETIAIAAKEASAEKSKSIEIGGLHICCGKCESSIDDALSEVSGVESVTIDEESGKVTVEGDFSPAEALTALNKAGLNGKL